MGSPPHMRGKEYTTAQDRRRAGITPAYAGKSACAASARGGLKDHPRICGEKHAVPVASMWSAGSPPHMRGKEGFCALFDALIGITPAYAGKSAQKRLCSQRYGDHPRICGEKSTSFALVRSLVGSPPHMRGKAHERSCTCHFVGITPAYAGKRSKIF